MANQEQMNHKREQEYEEVEIRGDGAPRRTVRHTGEQPRRRPQGSRPQSSKSSSARNSRKRRKSRNRQTARIFGVIMMLVLIFVVSITLSVGIIRVGKDMLGLEGTETLMVFNIPEGATTTEIADMLYEKGIIKIPKAFVYFSRLSKADAGYIAGDHEVSSAMAYEEIINELSGNAIAEDQVAVNVMFPEGCTLVEAADKLHRDL